MVIKSIGGSILNILDNISYVNVLLYKKNKCQKN